MYCSLTHIKYLYMYILKCWIKLNQIIYISLYILMTDLNLINRLRPLSISTSMSRPVYEGMNSTLAVDGNEIPQPDTCHCCSVTRATNPWWTLDLHIMVPIKRLIFIGRSESMYF